MSGKWLAIAPVRDYLDSERLFDQPCALHGGVEIGPKPQWLDNDPMIKHLDEWRRQRLRSDSRVAFAVRYDASSFRDCHPSSTTDRRILWRDYTANLIRLANLALWIVRPTSIAHELLVHADDDANGPRVRELQTIEPFQMRDHEQHVELDSDDLPQVKTIHRALVEFPRGGMLDAAFGVLAKALIEREWPSRYLFFWIVLECLFGPEDAREMTFRLSQRIALFLEEDVSGRKRRFRSAKKGYSWRSKVVHGAKLGKLKPEESKKLATETEATVRESLLKILSDDKLIECFDGKGRESYLDSLAF